MENKGMNSQIFNIEVITSKSNSTIVKYSKLLSKKSRKEFQLFTLDGVKLFEEAYNFGAEIECIIIKNDAVFDVKEMNCSIGFELDGGRISVGIKISWPFLITNAFF